ncbi:MAG TPA: hypothetical protein VFE17_07475 [Candidatus Baltobacteraceae bacterium]|jgi:hypothetical protein|nr:hypothetical protein [Candidatus Baltobacteraceae bacterium]
MFDVGLSLAPALRNAGEQIAQASATTARAGTSLGEARSEAAMAAIARTAVFSEALLNAVHARLAEIKSAAHQ